MTRARRDQFDKQKPPWVHCTSRCVRRAYLCGKDHTGKDYSHRKVWTEQRLQLIAQNMAVDIAAYAIMDNHIHIVLRMQPKRTDTWSPEEVTRRWLEIWPLERHPNGTAVTPAPEIISKLAQDTETVEKWRLRLADLGWLMKSLKEYIARQANKEDGCTGAFWEGRYTSAVLLTNKALKSCMAYVDLNPIRAAKAETPETSEFTSISTRLRRQEIMQKAAYLRKMDKHAQAEKLLKTINRPEQDSDSIPGEHKRPHWLAPLSACCIDGPPFTLQSYADFIDASGRLLHRGKRGRIPPELPAILDRLDIELDRWLETMMGWKQYLGTAVGSLQARAQEAARRGIQWIQNRCMLFD